jgi:hypothetical protein
MTPERWERVKEIYASAFYVRPSERPAFLDKSCAQDAVMRQEVERLLGGDQRKNGRLVNRPAVASPLPFNPPYPGISTELHPTSLREACRTILGSLRHQSPLRIRFVR